MKMISMHRIALLLPAAAVIAFAPDALANADYDGCRACHGDFDANPYTRMSADQGWGDDLHGAHQGFVTTGCDTCHTGGVGSAVPLIGISVYAISWMRPWQRLAWLALGIAIPGLLCAAYHWSVFGGPATLPYEFSTQPHRSQGFFMGLGVPEPGVMAELLVGRYRGLLYSSPWLAAALPGAWLLFRRPGVRAGAETLAVIRAWKDSF